MQDESIIRSERKLRAAVTNAQTYLRIRQEFGSFGEYLWRFVNHKPLQAESFPPPASTPLAERLSKDLRKRGMKFAGPVIVYSFMQASGHDQRPRTRLLSGINVAKKAAGASLPLFLC